jgi:hypothetical protein
MARAHRNAALVGPLADRKEHRLADHAQASAIMR